MFLSKVLLIGMLAASAFDIGTTEHGLKHRGMYEANPLMKNRGVRVTVNIAAPIALYFAIRNKPKKVQILATVPYIGLKTFVGVHNLKLASKHSSGEKAK